MQDRVPAPLALPQERLGGVDRAVSGIGRPVEEEGPLGFGLTLYELKSFL